MANLHQFRDVTAFQPASDPIPLDAARTGLRMTLVTLFFVLSPLLVDIAERHPGLALLCIFVSGAGPMAGMRLLLGDWPAERFVVGPVTVRGRALRWTGGIWLVTSFAMLVLAFTDVGAISFGYLIALVATLVVLLFGVIDLLVAGGLRAWKLLRACLRKEVVSISATPGFLKALRGLSSCCAVFVVPMMLTIVIGVAATQVEGDREVSSGGDPIRPGAVEPNASGRPIADASDLAILTGFEPVLSYGYVDGDLPIPVDDYLAEGTVTTIAPIVAETPLASLAAPPECVEATSPCLLVRHPSCRDSQSCRAYVLESDASIPELAIDERIAAYGRVLRREQSDLPDWDESPFGAELTTIAQWWYFTPIDDWSDHFLGRLGHATKQHDADWEQITIGFSDDRPLFVAFSSHCGGRWRLWNDVRVLNAGYEPADVLGTLLHVRAMRTDGSHGFYFNGVEGQSPDMGQCEFKPVRGLLRGHLTLAGVDDVTASFGYVLPRLITGAEAQLAFDYPAVWSTGTRANASIAGFEVLDRDNRSVTDPKGPESPAYKNAYRTPVRAIFCNTDAWTHENPHNRDLGRPECET